MIANVLNRLRPPPPAAATCQAQERVPARSPLPRSRVHPSSAAAASRRDGHLGQTELFRQFTSLKLHKLRAAPRPPQAARGAAVRGSAMARSAPRAVPGGLAARQRCQPGPHACVHADVTAEVRGQCPQGLWGHYCAAREGVHTGSPCCAGMNACPRACMRVHARAALPGTTSHTRNKLGLGCPCWRGQKGTWPVGAAQPTPSTCLHMAVPSPCPSPDMGVCAVPGVQGGGALPGKQEAPPGNEQHRFHSNLKGLQLPPR